MNSEFLSGFLLDIGACGCFAAACMMSYRLWLIAWLTTEGPEVHLMRDANGATLALVKVDEGRGEQG